MILSHIAAIAKGRCLRPPLERTSGGTVGAGSPAVDAAVQIHEHALKVCLSLPPCHAINSRRSFMSESVKATFLGLGADVVKPRVELLFLPLPYGFSHTLQRSANGGAREALRALFRGNYSASSSECTPPLL
jgi:hypothetical protein